MTKTDMLADANLMKAVDRLASYLEHRSRSYYDLHYLSICCDDSLRQRYGDDEIMALAYERLYSTSPELSEKASQWFDELNARYFGDKLPKHHVSVQGGTAPLEPLRTREYNQIVIHGLWEDANIIDLLLDEMVEIATEQARSECLKRERSRLKDAGAPFVHSGVLKPRRSEDGSNKTTDASCEQVQLV